MTQVQASEVCLYCGEQLVDLKHRGRWRRYCSGAHRSAARRQRTAGEPEAVTETFAAVLDELLSATPTSTRALAERTEEDGFFISFPTMSQWRKGEATPYLTEHTLHRVLNLERRIAPEPGRLVAALHRTAAKDASTGWKPTGGQPEPPAGPHALRAELEARGATNRCRSTLVAASDEYVIGDERRPEYSRHRYRVCAVAPGVHSVWVVFTVNDGSPLELVPLEGCTIGRQEMVADSGYAVRAVELRLGTTLEVGQCRDLAFTLVDPPYLRIDGVLWPGWLRVIAEPGCRRLDMRLRFAEHRPNEAWQGTWRAGADGVPEPDRQEPVGSADDWFTLSRTDPRPGAYGFRWRWARDTEPYRPIGPTPAGPR